MHGNVGEWCFDIPTEWRYMKSEVVDPRGRDGGDDRIFRGGCWRLPSVACRSANREAGLVLREGSGFRDHVGFRVHMLTTDAVSGRKQVTLNLSKGVTLEMIRVPLE
jgi:formylglycine-generating enzyme required for sulfatase activity